MPNAGTPTEVSYCNSERSYKSSVFQRSTSTRSGRWAELLQLHSPFNGCRFLPIQHQSITRVPNAFLHRICSPVARARSRLHRKSPKMTSWYWSGKSRFIKALLQSDDTAKRGQHPCTKNVQALKCNFNSGCNNVVFIDTPSFHTELEDFDVENQMPTWMKVKLTAKCHGSVVLFLHTLAKNPAHHDTLITRHLTTFAMSFNSNFPLPSCVHVMTTKEPSSPTKR